MDHPPSLLCLFLLALPVLGCEGDEGGATTSGGGSCESCTSSIASGAAGASGTGGPSGTGSAAFSGTGGGPSGAGGDASGTGAGPSGSGGDAPGSGGGTTCCGDDLCGAGESCSSCATDCGSCSPGGSVFFVSPDGSPGGDGSPDAPWDIVSAFVGGPGGSAVQPGDTILVRGGQYDVCDLTVDLEGTDTDRILVAAYPGERAELRASERCFQASFMLHQRGSYNTVRGFEIYDPTPGNRQSATSYPEEQLDIQFPHGVNMSCHHCDFIDNAVHDVMQGMSAFEGPDDSNGRRRIAGNIFFNNGWMSADESGEGPGLYFHSAITEEVDGVMTGDVVEDNFFLANLGGSGRCSGSSNAKCLGIKYRRNLLGMVGSTSGNFEAGGDAGYFDAGAAPMSDFIFAFNHTLPRQLAAPQFSNHTSFAALFPMPSPVIEDNYFYGAANFGNISDLSLHRNTFIGGTGPNMQPDHPDNTYLEGTLPTEDYHFIQGSADQPGRGNLYVYNWDDSPSFSVDISSVVAPGSSWEIVHALDPFGAPVAEGTDHTGDLVTIPMTGHTYQPIGGTGMVTPASMGPTFGMFVIRTTGQTCAEVAR